MEILTKSARETQKLGKKIANKLITESRKLKSDSALIIALTGDLGSGKTTFTQGFAEGLGISKRIISPTFILMRHYNFPHSTFRIPYSGFCHIDLYRLESEIEKELENLGIKDIWKDPKSIVLIEWAEKAKEFLPENTVWITFETVSENERKITIDD